MTTTKYDLSTPANILEAAVQLNVLTEEHKAVMALIESGAISKELGATMIAATVKKDVQAAIKKLSEIDHLAMLKNREFTFNKKTFTVQTMIDMIKTMTAALNEEIAAYNAEHDTKISIAQFDEPSLKARITRTGDRRDWNKLAVEILRPMYDEGTLTHLCIPSRDVELPLKPILNQAGDETLAFYDPVTESWKELGNLTKTNRVLAEKARVAPGNAWMQIYAGKLDSKIDTLADLYDDNADAETEE